MWGEDGSGKANGANANREGTNQMKCDDSKVLSVAYLISESMTRKELMKLILLLIDVYFQGDKDEDRKQKITEFNSRRKDKAE